MFLSIILNVYVCVGEASLKHVYNFLMHNGEWIQGQLDIPPLIGSSSDTSNQLTIDPVPGKVFNPLHQYCHIADCKFDHVSPLNSNSFREYLIMTWL